MLNGAIEGFDDRRGDGFLVSDDGQRFYFHCVNIANGTRTVPNGVRATAQRWVGHLGHDDAIDVALIVEASEHR